MAVHHSSAPLPAPAERNVPRTQRGDWATMRTLLPYLWEYKGRVIAALSCLVLAKVANVGVPVLLTARTTNAEGEAAGTLVYKGRKHAVRCEESG